MAAGTVMLAFSSLVSRVRVPALAVSLCPYVYVERAGETTFL